MRPIPSWPRMGLVGPNSPEARAMSVPQMPVVESLTSRSVGPGAGNGRDCSSKTGERPCFCNLSELGYSIQYYA